jgi:hypothetical protein
MQLHPHAIPIRTDGSCLRQRIPRGRCCNRYISEFHDRQFRRLDLGIAPMNIPQMLNWQTPSSNKACSVPRR